MGGLQSIRVGFPNSLCDRPDKAPVRRVIVAALDPDDVSEAAIALSDELAVGSQAPLAAGRHLLVPALVPAAIAEIGGDEQHHETEIACAAQDPVGLPEIGFVGSAEVAIAKERAVPVGIGGSVAGKTMLDKVDQHRVEPACPPVTKIDIRVLARQIGDQRPRGVAIDQKGTADSIFQISFAGLHAQRERLLDMGGHGRFAGMADQGRRSQQAKCETTDAQIHDGPDLYSAAG